MPQVNTVNIIYPLTTLGMLSISGPDASAFLQGQVTCDINRLTAQQALPGAICNAKGRIQANFLMLKKEPCYFLIIPIANIAIAFKHLKKYAVFSKVTIKEVSQDWLFCGLQSNAPPQEPFQRVDSGSLTMEQITYPTTGAARYLLATTQTNTLSAFCQEKYATDYTQGSEADWALEDIKAKYAKILPSTSNLFTPHMIELEKMHGVSFKKGCYLGQEIIARTQHLGKLKRHLQLVQINYSQRPLSGDTVTTADNQAIGTLINVEAIKPQHFLALAVLEDRALDKPQCYWNKQPIVIS